MPIELLQSGWLDDTTRRRACQQIGGDIVRYFGEFLWFCCLPKNFLIDGLKLFQVSQGKAMVVMMLMDTEEKRWCMMKFMQDNQNATEDEIVAEAYRIAAMKRNGSIEWNYKKGFAPAQKCAVNY